MPANLTPQYRKAESAFRQARTREEKIACLENMLAVIPKHKGTDRMQGDIKKRLAKLRKGGEGQAKGKKASVFRVEKEGAGQIVLLGGPNVGKSQLLASLTNASPSVAEYPFTTHAPQPGMVPFEDVQIQWVDMPPITGDYMEPWAPDIIRGADVATLVADLGDDGALDALDMILNRLEAMKIHFVREVPGDAAEQPCTFRRTVIVANKLDVPGAEDRLEVLCELFGERFDIWPVSATAGTGLDAIPGRLFEFLRVIRVYTKQPGKKADMKEPYTVPLGSTLLDLCARVHKDFEETLRWARLWGSGKYDGIRVKRDHVLRDRDVVELHE